MAAGIWIKMDRRYDETEKKEERENKKPKDMWLSSKMSKRVKVVARQYCVPLVVCPATFVALIATIEFFRQPTPAIVDAIWGINS